MRVIETREMVMRVRLKWTQLPPPPTWPRASIRARMRLCASRRQSARTPRGWHACEPCLSAWSRRTQCCLRLRRSALAGDTDRHSLTTQPPSTLREPCARPPGARARTSARATTLPLTPPPPKQRTVATSKPTKRRRQTAHQVQLQGTWLQWRRTPALLHRRLSCLGRGTHRSQLRTGMNSSSSNTSSITHSTLIPTSTATMDEHRLRVESEQSWHMRSTSLDARSASALLRPCCI
mmetsp:Transcript_26142/g.57272  ORF Transcript_26142/g.57272 Transcript_26142/m.57272 type:complete len:236 (+) Transcript_26142:1445-2152(+)